MLAEAKSARFKTKRDFETRWKKHSPCFKAYNLDENALTKNLAKFKSSISSALANSLHNLSVVSGLSVFIISGDKFQDKSFKQNLVLASCAQSCCRDSIFFVVSKLFPGHHGKERRVTQLVINKKDDLLATVENWAKQVASVVGTNWEQVEKWWIYMRKLRHCFGVDSLSSWKNRQSQSCRLYVGSGAKTTNSHHRLLPRSYKPVVENVFHWLQWKIDRDGNICRWV